MKYQIIERFAWYFPDNDIEVSVYRKQSYFRYELKNGDIINKDIIQLNVWAFIITWPLYLPGVLAIIGGKEVYHRYLKDRFSIPEDK